MNLVKVKNPYKDKLVFVEVTVANSQQTTFMPCRITEVWIDRHRASVVQLANPDNCIGVSFSDLWES